MCQSKTRSLELHPVGGNVQVYDPNFFDMKAELDAAKKELREIREAIGANPEESTTDEVRRVMSQLMTLKGADVILIAIANEITESPVMVAKGYQKGFGNKCLAAHDAEVAKAAFIAGASSFNVAVCQEAIKPKAEQYAAQLIAKAERLGISPRKQILSSHDAEVAAKAIEGLINTNICYETSRGLVMHLDSVKQYAAQLRAQVTQQ